MARPEWILDSSSFTSTSALAREIGAWLEFSDAKIIVKLHSMGQVEELENEMESVRTLSRVKVELW